MARTHPLGRHCTPYAVRLHYLDYDGGRGGAPILLLPGITSPAMTWDFVTQRLAQTHRVVVPDIRGRGLSESRSGLGYSLYDYAEDARGLIAAAGLERPIVIGHSMGARIAGRLAATAPELVSRLVLVDPPLSGPGRAAYPTPLNSYLDAMAAASNGATIESFRRFSPSWTDEQIAMRLQWLPTCSVEAVSQTHANFHSEDVFADFPRIGCPTLLVRAAKASVVSAGDANVIVAMLADGRAVSVAAGHMIPWDNLEGFLAAIAPFIAADSRPGEAST